MVLRSQSRAFREWQPVGSHPRWVADDQGESTGGCDVGELCREAKGQCAAEFKASLMIGNLFAVLAQGAEAILVRASDLWALPEEIPCAQLLNSCAPFKSQMCRPALTGGDGALALFAVECIGHGALPRPGCAGVAFAEHG